MTIKNLVLSGGAYKGFYTIGALKYLSKVDFYKIENIEKIYGTSVGSFISAVLCLKLNFDTDDLVPRIHPFRQALLHRAYKNK